ncbi:MAG: DMT family transporter [Beijerinckiaceae bacterium]
MSIDNPNLRGIVAMCFAMAAFMANDTAVKLASESLSVGQVVFLRGLMGVGIALALLAQQGALGDLRHLKRPIVILRSLLEGFTSISFIGALSLLPLATVTAIFLISPLMITVAGALFLGEKVRWRRWLAVLIGFAGMLIVVRPTQDGLNAGVALVIASTFFVVTRDLMTRLIPADVPTGAVALSTIIMATIAGGALMMFQHWQPVDAASLGPLALAAICVTAGNYAIIAAFRMSEVSLVSPFRYTLMVWAVIAGYLVFGHWPDPVTWIGIALIVAAGLYTLYREAIVARSS